MVDLQANTSNGVIRVGRKGRKKFAFGDDGAPFEVDVVVAWTAWVCVDDEFREKYGNEDRSIPQSHVSAYHQAAVEFVTQLAGSANQPSVCAAEALDFIARLKEQYDEVADFFLPKSREKLDLPDTSEAELRFSVEEN